MTYLLLFFSLIYFSRNSRLRVQSTLKPSSMPSPLASRRIGANPYWSFLLDLRLDSPKLPKQLRRHSDVMASDALRRSMTESNAVLSKNPVSAVPGKEKSVDATPPAVSGSASVNPTPIAAKPFSPVKEKSPHRGRTRDRSMSSSVYESSSPATYEYQDLTPPNSPSSNVLGKWSDSPKLAPTARARPTSAVPVSHSNGEDLVGLVHSFDRPHIPHSSVFPCYSCIR